MPTYSIEQVRKNVHWDLRMLGAVINLYKPQRNLSPESRAAVEPAIALVSHVFDTNLDDYSKIAEAPSQELPAVTYAEKHGAADQLWSLTDEIPDRLEMTSSRPSGQFSPVCVT